VTKLASQTDRQTDRQTDGITMPIDDHITLQYERLKIVEQNGTSQFLCSSTSTLPQFAQWNILYKRNARNTAF